MSEDKINKSRKPTPADLIILKYLESGQSINNVECIQKFKNAMLRDAIWRLKGADYPISSVWIKYETKEGKPKKYKSYFITPPEIKAAGQKVEKVMKGKTVSHYAGEVARLAKQPPVVQQSMFGEATMP